MDRSPQITARHSIFTKQLAFYLLFILLVFGSGEGESPRSRPGMVSENERREYPLAFAQPP